jgi:hypothetical protein
MKDILQPVVKRFLPYAKDKMGFDDAPNIYLRTDPENSESIFGKTAHYDPGNKSIVLYVHNRHPKDVLRSLSHELVHHAQNCRGEFDRESMVGEQGYAQKDPHLRKMEEEAYSVGNLVFRDFEDMMKEKTIYREFLEKGETLDMSHEKWRNKELGTLLSESWGFGFDLNRLTESEETVEEGMCAGKRDCPGCPKCQDKMEEGEELDEAKGEKGHADPLGGERAKFDKDHDGVPDGADKDPDDPEIGSKKKMDKKKMDETKLRAYIRKLIQESLKEG